MLRMRDMPIRRKVSLVVLVTCAVSLLLACVSLAVYEAVALRRGLVRDVTVLADIVGGNTRAALAFDDPRAATVTLTTLASEGQVVAARLYTGGGTPFADYVQSGLPLDLPSRPAADGHAFAGSRLVVVRPVTLDGARLGTIHVEADLGGIAARWRLLIAVAGLALLGSLGVAAALSQRLQRSVSQPIMELAGLALEITERQDFAIRAAEQGRDEVGSLTRAFNQMLAGIEARERALSEVNSALVTENLERRLAEGKVHAQLASLELLNQITRATAERQDQPSVFQVVVASLVRDLPSELACIGLYDPADRVLNIAARSAIDEVADSCLPVGMSIGVQASGLEPCLRGALVCEPESAAVASDFAQALAGAGLRSVVAAPLLCESSVSGVLLVARHASGAFSSNECEFLRQLSEHVALSANQAQLYSALEQAYEDLRRTQQAIMQQERLRALGEMASGIAHDINNTLSPVSLYTGLLAEEPNLSRSAREYIDITQRAVRDVADTVGRLKEFYRLSEPQLELAPIQIHALLHQVIDLTRGRWKAIPLQRGVVIRIETELADEPDPIVVMGVESELREALINLIFNAADAMPEGGTITLRTRTEAPRQLAAGTKASRRIHLEVSDTGAGMDERTRRRCLEPFFTTKGDLGTGLGLAMVYGTAQRHNADLEIESSLGRGTTIRLMFSAPTQPARPESMEDAPRRIPSRLRVLAVDDDPLVLRALCHALEIDGHVVVPIHGGQEGIEAFRAALDRDQPFSVVITDLGMPHIDGRRVASAVKVLSPATPVVLLTGWGQRLLSDGGVPPHVDCVLNKPPKLGELRAALLECCNGESRLAQ